MSFPILATKLYIPQQRARLSTPTLVSRVRLIAKLDEGLSCKLTLISAPAGFGKTTLVADWLQQQKSDGKEPALSTIEGPETETETNPPSSFRLHPSNLAWLSLDEADNDLVRFLIYIIAALQPIIPQLDETFITLLQSPQPPPSEFVLTSLLNAVALNNSDIVLVLDDYQVINTSTIHNALNFMLDHLPPQFHLIITTRSDPPLLLSRLRARGQMIELRADDLRFTQAEAAAFLNQMMRLNLSAADIAVLETRTEGWIAGLQMAALSMQGRSDVSQFVSTFSSRHRYIMSYLVEEVLSRQPARVQEFLLQTSILNRLNSSLCHAILCQETEGLAETTDSSQEMLEYLERANLFIVPLDDEGLWYRYHHLFAGILTARLQQMQPDLVIELRRRASLWFEQNGFIDEAILHALAAPDPERVAQLIEMHGTIMANSGLAVTVQNWLQTLPTDLVRTRPRLSLTGAFVALNSQSIESYLQAAEQLQANWPLEQMDLLRGETAAIRSRLANFHGENQQAITYAQQALNYLPEQHPVRSVIAGHLGYAYWRAGNLTAAEKIITQTLVSLPAGADMLMPRVVNLVMLGAVRHAQGRLREATELCSQALGLIEGKGYRQIPSPSNTFTDYITGLIYYEHNDLDKAERHLRQCLDMCPQIGNFLVQCYSWMALAWILQARGNLADSAELFEKAKAMASQENWSSTLAISEAEQVDLWLRQGKLAAAADWADTYAKTITDGEIQLDPLNFAPCTLARVRLAQNQIDEAQKLLAQLHRNADSNGYGRFALGVLVLQALTWQARGDLPQALDTLNQALALAEPQGYIRVFVDEGQPMAKLLRYAQLHSPASDYIATLLTAFPNDDLEMIKEEPSSLYPSSLRQAQDRPFSPQALIEPLTARELEVLHLVAAGLSDRQIAQELVVAVGTVKRHLNNFYGKLGVNSRTQALARAKELGLL